MDSEKLNNLYILARRAKDENNIDNAQKYYEELLLLVPNDWEPIYYSAYYKALDCKRGEIASATSTLKNSTSSCFKLIKSQLSIEDQQKACNEIVERTITIGMIFFNNGTSFEKLESFGTVMGAERFKIQFSSMQLIKEVADDIINVFDDKINALKLYKFVYDTISDKSNIDLHFVILQNKPTFGKELESKIKELDPNFIGNFSKISTNSSTSTGSSKSGCYVATCVYGSYDCPEVWTLRRYRDYSLSQTWFGRAFIRTYYAISPTIVKWFGNTNWFKSMWQHPLNRMVRNLQNKGYEDTPYQDREW